MKTILTGIQSTGIPHLGNIIGSVLPAIQLSQSTSTAAFFFIADLHSLTTVKDAIERKKYIYAAAATWLSFDLETDRHLLYRQSAIPEVCELAWYLSCYTPYPMMANAHAFKEKKKTIANVSIGLFTYPILMAADILLYDASLVPVGHDQLQHLEIARDIVGKFNQQYEPIFNVPEAIINTHLSTIPGIDGRKMSKSYHNTINIFLPEEVLKKNIMAITTDSTPLDQPKNFEQCIIFNLYKSLANQEQINSMKKKYLHGNYGYGQAKIELFELILSKFKKERKKYNYYMNNTSLIESKLENGEKKAGIIAKKKIKKIRYILGY